MSRESKVFKTNFVVGSEGNEIFENCVLEVVGLICNLKPVSADNMNKVVEEHLSFNVNIENKIEFAPNITEVIDIQRNSSLQKLVLLTCYVLKLNSKLKRCLLHQERIIEDNITVDEYKKAIERWIKCE